MDTGVLLLIILSVFFVYNLLGLNAEPNYMIGYRTKRSKATPASWKFAQRLFPVLSIVFILLIMVLHRERFINNQLYVILCLLSCILAGVITEYILFRREEK